MASYIDENKNCNHLWKWSSVWPLPQRPTGFVCVTYFRMAISEKRLMYYAEYIQHYAEFIAYIFNILIRKIK